MKKFLQTNKVLISGLVTAVLMSVYQLKFDTTVDWVLVGYTAFIAGGSFLANKLRGQWATIAGVVLPTAAIVYQAHAAHTHVDFGKLLLAMAVQVGLAVSPPPKSLAYEKSPTIEQAKAEAEIIQQTTTTTTTIPT